MSRPPGITVISLLLGWLAVAGIGNAVVWNLSSVQDTMRQIPGDHVFPSFGGTLFTVLALAYAATAAAACVGLWRMRSWSPQAYAAWCTTVLALGIYMATRGFSPSLLLGLLFSLFMTGFVLLGYPYVARKIRPRTL